MITAIMNSDELERPDHLVKDDLTFGEA